MRVNKAPAEKQPELSELTGTPEHPANYGRLCVKGSHLLTTTSHDGRLLSPKVNGKEVEWDTATDAVASRFKQIIDTYGPDAVAFYVSGQLLTEDYYVANKLMKGYIGSANIDTNSRLCMSSAVAAYKRAFGSDTVPTCYEDLEQTDLLVLTGSNAAWTHPVLFQRIERAKQMRPDMKVVVIDPRATATCSIADLHLPLKPGTDVALFSGLLEYLHQHGYDNLDFVENHTSGKCTALAKASCWTLKRVANYCDVDPEQLESFYKMFAQSETAISFYSMGVNQSSSGVDKANSIINCHLLTGKIGKPGCGPFSITGQPNAMGGREVGGLANMLAAHMDIDNIDHQAIVQSFWNSPKMADKPGYKAVDLFDEIERGKIKAVWIMATNPLVSMPNRNKIKRALEACELVVVSDCVERNDTTELADIVLPATTWSEKDGTVTNSERRISRQRGLVAAPGLARHDWQIICDVASKMGFAEAFDYQHPHDIFIEHAALTGYKNDGSRDLDISGLANISRQQYDDLRPIQWPVNAQYPQGKQRMFEDGRFFTSDQRAHFVAVAPLPPSQQTCEDYPFVLNTGRSRDQWHTMTRTGKSALLSQHQDKAYLSMHPVDAETLSVESGDLIALSAKVSSDKQVILPVVIDKGLRKGEVFAPIHWNGQHGSSTAVANLFSDACDKLSGQPELKHAAVALERVNFSSYADVYCQQPIPPLMLSQTADYWCQIVLPSGYLYQFASDMDVKTLSQKLSQNTFGCDSNIGYSSDRLATNVFMSDGQLVGVTFVKDQSVNSNPEWVDSLKRVENLSSENLNALLAAEPEDSFMKGRKICSCYNVYERDIEDAVEAGEDSVEKLGAALKCGTNCGSCKSELKPIIERVTSQQTLIPVEVVS